MIQDIITQDVNALPQALLANFKRRERIDFCDDDTLITELLQDAIGEFQRRMEITLYASQIVLSANAADFRGDDLRLGISPVNSIAIADDTEPPNDVTGDYRLTFEGLHGVRIYHLKGAAADGLAMTILTGYAPADLPPDIRQVLMRMTGHLYENREIYAANQASVPEAWLNEVMAGFWLPRA